MNVGNHTQVELQPGVQIINVSAISLGENIGFQPSNTNLTTQNTGGRLTIELDPVIWRHVLFWRSYWKSKLSHFLIIEILPQPFCEATCTYYSHYEKFDAWKMNTINTINTYYYYIIIILHWYWYPIWIGRFFQFTHVLIMTHVLRNTLYKCGI